MQIDHIALYTRDLERLCEFYTKYFDGTAGKLYQNEETGTQACFVSFADGARLEIVTRPITDGPVVGKDGCYGSFVLDPDGNTVRIVA